MREANVREEAVISLVKIEREGAFSNLETREVLSRSSFKSEDKALYLKLVYGTLQNQIWLDHILSQVVDQPFQKVNDYLKAILRTAVYQIYFLDRIPDYAVVDEAVRISGRLKKQGKGFVNGVLRNLLRKKDQWIAFDLNSYENEKEGLALHYSLPQRIVFQYFEAFGDEKAMKIISQLNETAPLTIRVNTLKTSSEDLMAIFESLGYDPEKGKMSDQAIHLRQYHGLSLGEDPHYLAGEFSIQDQGAMVLSELLDPQPGERVLDMCAAPGGKTTHMAQLMKNQGEIFARDIHESRLKLIDEAASRQGIHIIRTEKVDGTVLNPIDLQYFDRILLDAPCTGTGILRRKPEIRFRMNRKERRAIREIQEKMLDNAVRMLKHGGKMVYSTCTVDGVENSRQIEKMLENHPEMSIVPSTMGYTDPFIDGCDVFFHCLLEKNKRFIWTKE